MSYIFLFWLLYFISSWTVIPKKTASTGLPKPLVAPLFITQAQIMPFSYMNHFLSSLLLLDSPTTSNLQIKLIMGFFFFKLPSQKRIPQENCFFNQSQMLSSYRLIRIRPNTNQYCYTMDNLLYKCIFSFNSSCFSL